MLTGRMQSRAPGTDVRITLAERDHEAEAEPRSGHVLAAKMRSALFPEDDNDGFPGSVRPHASSASEGGPDAESAAHEATKPAPWPSRLLAARSSSGNSGEQARSGYGRQRSTSNGSVTAGDAGDSQEGPPRPEETQGTNADDGENPLPPALESRTLTASRPSGRAQRSFATPPRRFPEEVLDASSGVAPASYSQGGDESADEGETSSSAPQTFSPSGLASARVTCGEVERSPGFCRRDESRHAGRGQQQLTLARSEAASDLAQSWPSAPTTYPSTRRCGAARSSKRTPTRTRVLSARSFPRTASRSPRLRARSAEHPPTAWRAGTGRRPRRPRGWSATRRPEGPARWRGCAAWTPGSRRSWTSSFRVSMAAWSRSRTSTPT